MAGPVNPAMPVEDLGVDENAGEEVEDLETHSTLVTSYDS